MTSLMKACMNGHVEIVKLLLSFGANPRTENKHKDSSLLIAISAGNVDICERLIVAKADITLRDQHGKSAILKATENNLCSKCSPIIDLLLSHGANIMDTDYEDNTVLHHAAMKS